VGAWRRPLLVTAAAVGSLALLLLIIGPAAWWAGGDAVTVLHGKERADAINAVRQSLLGAATGLAALSALFFTGRSFYLNRRGQLTDRYVKALSLLGSAQMTERVGGVFALEHLMRESGADHDPVVQVLAAFVRDRCPAQDAPPQPGPPRAGRLPWSLVRCPTDVQAALTVLGRRPDRPERPIDLSHAGLSGADLTGARLAGASLVGTVLSHAGLVEADLTGADLTDAVLTHSILTRGTVRNAMLVRADLRHAILANADLSGATLFNADLRFAGLPGADLTRAHLAEARFEGAELVRTRLVGAVLAGAGFDQAVLFGQVRCELFDALDQADPDHANLAGVKLSPGDEQLFPAETAGPPLPAEKPGYFIGHSPGPGPGDPDGGRADLVPNS